MQNGTESDFLVEPCQVSDAATTANPPSAAKEAGGLRYLTLLTPKAEGRTFEQWFMLFHKFYCKHDHSKLPELLEMLESCRGAEDDMWHKTLGMHGVTEDTWYLGPPDWDALFHEFYSIHDPDKLAWLPMLLNGVNALQVWQKLPAEYGVTPQNWRRRPQRVAPAEITGPSMFVFVRSFDGIKTRVEVGIEATVRDLLNAYEQVVDERDGGLSFQEAELCPDDTLADSSVCMQSVVEYLPAQRTRGWKPRDNAALRLAVQKLQESNSRLTPEIQDFFSATHGAAKPPRSFLIRYWDTSEITSMDGLFADSSFNEDISEWDTGAVRSMKGMFRKNSAFNQDISRWNTAAVTDMASMFGCAGAFDQDIGRWNTGGVRSMRCMFGHSTFNQDIGAWNTAAVTDMGFMFYSADFNQDISRWNTAAVRRMDAMFMFTHVFNQDLRAWNVKKVWSCQDMVFGNTTIIKPKFKLLTRLLNNTASAD